MIPKDLGEAAEFIGEYCRKRKLGGTYKTKWDQVRFYPMWGFSIHGFLYPGYYYKYSKLPNWLWQLDCKLHDSLLYRLIGKFWIPYQRKVYSDAYLKAIHKYPHLRAHILCGADNPEYIKGVTRTPYQDEDGDWCLDILGWDGEKIGGWRAGSNMWDVR